MPELHHEDSGVFLLDLGDSENRFHPDWIASVNDPQRSRSRRVTPRRPGPPSGSSSNACTVRRCPRSNPAITRKSDHDTR